MKLLSPAISRLARFRHWRIEQWINNPIESQREVLQDLVTHGQYTEFGRKHNFKELFNIRKFKQHLYGVEKRVDVPVAEIDRLTIREWMAGLHADHKKTSVAE